MMALFFLILFAVGILRPIKNSLALDGLAQSQFYRVYLVSALVAFFAPAMNHMADRIPWRRLIPATAGFFALNLLAFRALYSEGSTVLGMVFYGWYDLFAAALVAQFFMAVQVFFNSRDAKSAIPLVIASGSFGATLGGITTGVLAERLGTPNLLILASLFVGAFALVLPAVWSGHAPVATPGKKVEAQKSFWSAMEVVRVFSHRHIRLIAVLVLCTVVVKTVVDYEFNEAVAAFAGDRDAISSFQGYVFGAINWLPIVILVPLGPLLRRWGVGVAVLMLPIAMLGATAALAIAFSVWVATVAKAADATFRYSAERAGREILYVPVPTELKLKAKAYIDVAVEKGLGKALSGVLIFVLLEFMDYNQVAWAAVALAVAWLLLALKAKREYVTALAGSMRGRFASLEGGFARLTERTTLSLVEEALRGPDVDVAFGLDLVEQAGAVDARPLADEMELLLDHPSAEIRARVLHLLARFPDLVDEERIRPRLDDDSDDVREAAVAALVAGRSGSTRSTESTGSTRSDNVILEELLDSDDPRRRRATLSALVRGTVADGNRESLARAFIERHLEADDLTVDARRELALAAGLLDGDARTASILAPLIEDPDPGVAGAALRSAGLAKSPELLHPMIAALADPALREEAREALESMESAAVELLASELLDHRTPTPVRLQIPRVLAGIPLPESVGALLELLSLREEDREIRYRGLKALNKLRVRDDAELTVPDDVIRDLVRREVEESEKLDSLGAALERCGASGPGIELLLRSVGEAWRDRREWTFRLLGLVFPHQDIYRSYLGLTRGHDRNRANALEWLESTVDRSCYLDILPVLERHGPDRTGGVRKRTGSEPDGRLRPGPSSSSLEEILDQLAESSDRWLAHVATWNLTRHRPDGPHERIEENDGMDLIEKVFLLQNVDLLQGARSSHLGLLASIADEVDVSAGETLIRRGESNDSLYILVRGEVELEGMAGQTLSAEESTPFGTWSLIDSDPSVVGARAVDDCRLLRITRSDFQDLLSDHPQLAIGMLQGLARRIRSLVA